jgi:hypothetical protein
MRKQPQQLVSIYKNEGKAMQDNFLLVTCGPQRRFEELRSVSEFISRRIQIYNRKAILTEKIFKHIENTASLVFADITAKSHLGSPTTWRGIEAKNAFVQSPRTII